MEAGTIATLNPHGAMDKPKKDGIEAAYNAIMTGAKLPIERDPEAVSKAIMERIAKAETFEDAFQQQTLQAWREFLGRPCVIHAFHLNESSLDTGQPYYAVVDLEWLDDASKQTVTCGGGNVLVSLVKIYEKGWMDRAFLLESKRTNEGYDVLWLRPAVEAPA